MQAEREYLRKFVNTGGGEPIPKDEKWTTERRDPEQGRNPKNGQFIDNFSIGRETKYPERGKNNVPYIMRTMVASYYGFKEPEQAAHLTEEQLDRIVRKGSAFGTEDAQAVLDKSMTMREFITAWKDGSITEKASLRKGNYKTQENATPMEYRMGHRDRQYDSDDGKTNSDGWNDNDFSDAEINNLYQKDLKKVSVDPDTLDDLAEAFSEGDEHLKSVITNRLKNLGVKLALTFGRTDDIKETKQIVIDYLFKNTSSNVDTLENRQAVEDGLFNSGAFLAGSAGFPSRNDVNFNKHSFKRSVFTREYKYKTDPKTGKPITDENGEKIKKNTKGARKYGKGTKDTLGQRYKKDNAKNYGPYSLRREVLEARGKTTRNKELNEKQFDKNAFEANKKAGMAVDAAKKAATSGRGNFIADPHNKAVRQFKAEYQADINRGMSKAQAAANYQRKLRAFKNQYNYRAEQRKHRNLK